MKRDIELVRKILLLINEHDHGYFSEIPHIAGYSEEQIGYHCFLLAEAGLIDASDISSDDSLSPTAIPTRLTWEGHEFVENSMNDGVWNQTKGVVEKVGHVAFSVWAQILTQVVMKNLGI